MDTELEESFPLGVTSLSYSAVAWKVLRQCVRREHKTPAPVCFATLQLVPRSTIVRPYCYEWDREFTASTERASEDFRTDRYRVLDITTPSGEACESGLSPFRGMQHQAGTEVRAHYLDMTYLHDECEPGLHFFRSKSLAEAYARAWHIM